MGLASHCNVFNTCLRILRARGFELSVSGDLEPNGCYPANCLWIARKDGFYFCGDNPIELMGLVAVYDHVKPAMDESYWWKVDGPDVWTELMETAFPDEADNAASGKTE